MLLETRQLLAAFTTVPSQTRKRTINNLIASLKRFGLWDKMGAMYVLAAHDQQAAKINWKAPTETALAETATVTFTVDRGFAGDGATGSLAGPTAIPSIPGCSQDSTHVSVWNLSTGQAASPQIGKPTTSDIFINSRNVADQAVTRVNNTTAFTGPNTNASGFYVTSRTASNLTDLYKNGVLIATNATASAAGASEVLSFFKVGGSFLNHQCSFGAAGSGLNAADAALLYPVVYQYMVAVGAA